MRDVVLLVPGLANARCVRGPPNVTQDGDVDNGLDFQEDEIRMIRRKVDYRKKQAYHVRLSTAPSTLDTLSVMDSFPEKSAFLISNCPIALSMTSLGSPKA